MMLHFARRLLAPAFLTGLGALVLAGPAEAVEIEEVTSPGGIKALLVEDYTNPLIAMRFAFEGAGSTQDAPGKEGTANLLSGLLDEGAGDIGSQAFQERLDDLGVSLSFDAGYDNFSGNFRTIVDGKDEAFDLLRLAIGSPRFDEEPVSRIRGQIAAGIRADENNPGQLASDAFRTTLFPNHPYSRPMEGTADSLAGIGKAELADFRSRTFSRGNLVVGVVGAIDAGTLGETLDKVFGALPETARLRPVPDVEPQFGKVEAVELAVPQTMIRFAVPGVKRDDDDFFAAFLVNHILGGGTFTSRLYEEIREKRGLAYGASSSLVSYDHAAMIAGGTATRADMAPESVRIVREELKRLADQGPSEDELAKAKAYVKGSYAIQNLDSSLAIASTLVGIQLDRLGTDYIDKRQAIIDGVTMDDVKRVAKRLLSVEPTVITVGPSGA